MNYERDTDSSILESDSEAMQDFLLTALSEHWKEYFNPEHNMRLGDESVWDQILYASLVEDFALSPEEAQHLCTISKFNSQFTE